MTLRERINDTLQELLKEELDSFQWQLQQPNLDGQSPIKGGIMEKNKTTMQTTDLIVSSYAGKAEQMMVIVLKKIKKHQLAEEFQKGGSAGAAPPQTTSTGSGVTAAGGSNMVTEQQLMQVAKGIGRTWKKIGTMLGITDVKLQQIEEENPRDHGDRVHQMLLYWKKCQKKNATAAYLHSKLEELDAELIPDDIDFLLE